MSGRRSHAAEFAKLLEAVSEPLYVLDDSLTLVYLNEAARAWLGPAADDLLGQPCLYHSGDDPLPAAQTAAGLCPPPTVLEGREVAAAVTYASEQGTLFRRARFMPVRSAHEQVLCVFAIVDPHDSSEPLEEARPLESDDAREFHLHLQRFRQQQRLRYEAHGIVGVTPSARRASAQAAIAAATRGNVLLVGPPGSGRRYLAEAIHYGGPDDSPGPLVPQDCSLLDEELIQDTLRSAGASGQDGGTLLLIDADRIPATAQATLAAALNSPGCRWRTIATSAAPLVDLVTQGTFREDLAACLSTITIELPALSKRGEDVPLLAQALLEEENALGGKQLGGFTPEALDLLCAYRWPGNLAELAKVVAESHVHAAGTQVTRGDLPERLSVAAEAAARPRRKEEPIQLDEFVARIERELIRRALARSKGNKTKAARLLGLNRPRLYRRMVQLGLIEDGAEE